MSPKLQASMVVWDPPRGIITTLSNGVGEGETRFFSARDARILRPSGTLPCGQKPAGERAWSDVVKALGPSGSRLLTRVRRTFI
ncbi:hypothetical protein VTH82DRAFT_3736 [Thermothelomyces myriococcoides]